MKKIIITAIGILLGASFFTFLYFRGKTDISKEWASGKLKNNPNYDVIVVGGDPEGVAAAVSSARSGAKTLLLIKEDGPGGLMTYGMLNTIDMNRDRYGKLQTRGIFEEFYNGIGNTESFDVDKAKQMFLSLIEAEENLTYITNKTFSSPVLEGKTIIGVNTADGEQYLGNRIIDATPDGDVCVTAGTPYFNGREDINLDEKMCTTLVFRLGGVSWKELKKDVDRYIAETGDTNSGINRSTAWAFGKWCYDKYTPLQENMKLRGLNIGKQDDGSILINALQIFGVDVKNKESIKIAKDVGTREVDNILAYLKTILESFKDAYVIGVADELYVRETQHILGEYVLTATDLLENTNFYDKIALGSYPIDIQSTDINNYGYVIGTPEQYSIPLRCIVPQEIDNLFIVGKAASYSSVAAGSARVIPIGMACGESAGIAAVYSIVQDITPRELTKDLLKIEELTEILRSQGVYLPEYDIKWKNAGYPGYEQIKKLINLGMTSGGYNNDFDFEKEMTTANFGQCIINMLRRLKDAKYDESVIGRIKACLSNDKLTGRELAYVIAEAFNKDMSNNEMWDFANEYMGIYKDTIKEDTAITRGQMYYITVNVVEKLCN